MDREKISKLLGNVIDQVWFVDKYGVDWTRLHLMSEVHPDSNIDVTHLANELGNLVYQYSCASG